MQNGQIDKKMAKQADKYNKQRLEECVPVAREVMKIIAESGLTIGDTHARDTDQYNAVGNQILKLMLEHNIKFADHEFVFQLALQPLDTLREIVVKSLKVKMDYAIDKALGKDYLDIRLSDLDMVLRTDKTEKH